MRLKLVLLFTVILCNVGNVFSQASADEVLMKVTAAEQEVNNAIIKNELHHHAINLNNNKKEWLGIKDYREEINCYFDLQPNKVTIKKILVITYKGDEKAYKNYLFDDNGKIQLTYSDYESGTEKTQKSAFFYNAELLAFTSAESMVMGDDLSDEMVTLASGMYRQGLKYRKFFQGLLLIQMESE